MGWILALCQGIFTKTTCPIRKARASVAWVIGAKQEAGPGLRLRLRFRGTKMRKGAFHYWLEKHLDTDG